jgi:hypothetical protein
MKKNEVPQDNEGLQEGLKLDLYYVLDEQGNYVTVPSCGWAPKNAAMLQAWDVINQKVEEVRQQIIAGKVSPIAFFMEKNIMTPKLLASYAGLPKWKVKRHLKPSGFAKLNVQTLKLYADIFEITLDTLTNFKVTAENK